MKNARREDRDPRTDGPDDRVTAPTALDAEQRVADAFFRWAPGELARRRAQADEATRRARQTNDEVRWQVAERAEGRWIQLRDMVSAGAPYFARIQCTLAEGAAGGVPLDLRVSNFPRSESFPASDGTEVLDVSHLAAVADLVRNPAQRRLVIPLTEQQLLQAEAGGPLSVHDALVEDVEWDGPTIARVAPRFGAVFEDRVARRLKAGPSTSLEAMADVLDPAQSQVLSDRDPARRVLVLDGPAGTGKTVVAAHRIAVVAGPDRAGLYVVPSTTLAAYVKPALPRLGLEGRGTRVVTPIDLLAELAPELLPEVQSASASAWSSGAERAIPPSAGRAVDLVRVVRGWPDALRHPSALLLLAARAGRRLPEPPAWVIVDEAQAFGEADYRALGLLAARDAWWVLAGDLLQREYATLAWADVLSALGMPKRAARQVWLKAAYRIPPTIHAAAEEIRRQLDPDGRASESVRWHPVPGQVAQVAAPPQDALRTWLQLARSTSLSGTGAVIVPDSYQPEQLAEVREALANLGSPPHLLTPDPVYRGGLVLAPLKAVRGLEFDAVLIWDACADAYPRTPAAGRRLYTALTRARRLVVAACPPDATPTEWAAAWPRLTSA